MKKGLLLVMLGLAISLSSCGDKAKEKAEAEKAAAEKAEAEKVAAEKAEAEKLKAALNLDAGKLVYDAKCALCHGKEGQGMPSFPPVAGSDYLTQDNVLAIITQGLKGEITVNGVKYNTPMLPVEMSEQELVDVSNYILNSWGNNKGKVTLPSTSASAGK